jgi:hypothetical protein
MSWVSLAAFKDFSLSFKSLIIMGLSVCGSFGVHWASWVFTVVSFIKFGKISAIISSNILSPSIVFSLLSILSMVDCLLAIYWSYRLCSLFFGCWNALYSMGWPGTQDASASWVLGLQTCATMPISYEMFCFIWSDRDQTQALCMLGKWSTTELYPHPWYY